MTFKPDNQPSNRQAGFTLAEALAAMMFLAIVIPVAVGGLHVASLAGELSVRKAVAARIGQAKLNELRAMGQLSSSGQSGSVIDNGISYRWSVHSSIWTEDTTVQMYLATMTVSFPTQGKTYDVQISTLAPQPTQ